MKKIAFLLCVISLMLASFTAGVEYQRGDVDHNGDVNIADVTCLISYLLKGNWPDEPQDEHEWVDLGLPSGTLWATCNVGATTPEECGEYFAWGETEPKDNYDLSNYKWCNGSENTMTKYCTKSSYGYNGFVDNKTELDPEDDAAYVNWGPSWRMPTSEQLQEMVDNCTWTWTTQNGVDGQLVTGPNGNTMFLPAAGSWYASLGLVGYWGFYWSLTLCSSSPEDAFRMYFGSITLSWSNDGRHGGFPVRAVRASQN